MKKAKLILAGIACMAVVGGAYAVKANRGVTSYCRIGSTGLTTTKFNNTSFVPTTTGSVYCTFDPQQITVYTTNRALLSVQP